MTASRYWISILLALTAGIFLFHSSRLARTAVQRGVFQYDEAYYLLEAKGLATALRSLPDVLTQSSRVGLLKNEMRERGYIFPPGTAKTTHTFFLALFSYLPIPLSETGNLLSVASLLLMAGLLYLLSQELQLSRSTGLFLSVQAAVSPVLGYYAVSSYPHLLSSTLFLLSVLLFLKGNYIVSGLVLGMTFTCHYAALPSILIFLLWALFHQRRIESSRPIALQRALRLLGGFAVLPLLYQGIFLATGHALQNYTQDVSFRSYFSQVYRQLHESGAPMQTQNYFYTLRHNLAVFKGLAATEGYLLFFLMMVSLLFLVFNIRLLSLGQKGILGFTVGLVIFWVFNPGLVLSRIAVFLWPFLFFEMGLAYFLVVHNWKSLTPFFSTVFLVLIVISSLKTQKLLPLLRSPYPKAAEELKASGYKGPVYDAACWPLWQLYLGKRQPFRPETIGTFRELQTAMQDLQKDSSTSAPFFLKDRFYIANDQDLNAFYQRLLSQPPNQSWTMPTETIPLSQHEDYHSSQRGIFEPETLRLYWVGIKDLRHL